MSRHLYQAILVTFSGIDGAGKSTQLNLLQESLTAQGLPTRYLWSRGGYTSGFEKIKLLLRQSIPGRLPPSGHNPKREQQLKKRWIQTIWLIVAILDLTRVYAFQIRWWLRRGNIVICDRYIGDTLIDFQLNFPAVNVSQWWLWQIFVWLAPQPQNGFLLMIDPDESERRALAKNDPFPEPWEKRQKRYNAYLNLTENGQVCDVIDASESIQQQHQYICHQVQRSLQGKE